ncbi:MAG: polyphenol oxidase family protein [Patescibacteria group bacterium]
MSKKPEEVFYEKGFFEKVENFPARNGITNVRMGDFSLNQDQKEAEDQLRRIVYMLNVNAVHRAIPMHRDIINFAENRGGVNYYEGDAIISKNGKNKKVLVCPTGDCPIIILTNDNNDFGAIIHCGWRPLKEKIIPKTLSLIKALVSLDEVKIGIFPGICVGCYEVTHGFAEGCFDDYILPNRKLNLKKVIIEELITKGINAKNIQICNYCSAHEIRDGDNLYYSYRRDNNGKRNIVFMVI